MHSALADVRDNAIGVSQRIAGANGIVIILIDNFVLINAIIIGVAFTAAADCFALKRPRARYCRVGGCGHAWARTRGSCHSNACTNGGQRWGHLCGASGQQRGELCGVRRCEGGGCDARLLVSQRRGGRRLRRARAVTEWGVWEE